jgi:hypothetical protein
MGLQSGDFGGPKSAAYFPDGEVGIGIGSSTSSSTLRSNETVSRDPRQDLALPVLSGLGRGTSY